MIVFLLLFQFESLNAELEHNQELANSRMSELEKLQVELQEAVRESEKLKVNIALFISVQLFYFKWHFKRT